jgi:APA family basic amino acid/polyamine antiporter
MLVGVAAYFGYGRRNSKVAALGGSKHLDVPAANHQS